MRWHGKSVQKKSEGESCRGPLSLIIQVTIPQGPEKWEVVQWTFGKVLRRDCTLNSVQGKEMPIKIRNQSFKM